MKLLTLERNQLGLETMGKQDCIKLQSPDRMHADLVQKQTQSGQTWTICKVVSAVNELSMGPYSVCRSQTIPQDRGHNHTRVADIF